MGQPNLVSYWVNPLSNLIHMRRLCLFYFFKSILCFLFYIKISFSKINFDNIHKYYINYFLCRLSILDINFTKCIINNLKRYELLYCVCHILSGETLSPLFILKQHFLAYLLCDAFRVYQSLESRDFFFSQ